MKPMKVIVTLTASSIRVFTHIEKIETIVGQLVLTDMNGLTTGFGQTDWVKVEIVSP